MHPLSRIIVITATYSVLCIATLHDAITQHNSGVRAVPALVITIFPNIASNQSNCWGTTKGDWRREVTSRLEKSTDTMMLQIVATSTILIRKDVRDCKTRDADADANAV